MNNSNLSEMALDVQNQMIDSTEYELDETALESVNGGAFSDLVAGVAGWWGEVVGDIASIPSKSNAAYDEGVRSGYHG